MILEAMAGDYSLQWTPFDAWLESRSSGIRKAIHWGAAAALVEERLVEPSARSDGTHYTLSKHGKAMVAASDEQVVDNG